jgi:single-strand DNA-binding protein
LIAECIDKINLTRDIEVRFSASNLAIGSTGIATNRKFKTQTGEEKEEISLFGYYFFWKNGRDSKPISQERLKDFSGGKTKTGSVDRPEWSEAF